LGAIGLEESLPLLEQYRHDPVPEVAETCGLAIDTIRYKLKHRDQAYGYATTVICGTGRGE